MADKQRAYDTRKNTDLFADDDPLAELARIVGFEPRVAANTVADEPRLEPAFNLEDELLREFERYDAPHAPAVIDTPAEVELAEVVSHVEPAFEVPAVASEEVEHAVYAQPEGRSVLSSADWTSGVPRAEPTSGGARDLIEELELSIGAAPSPVQPAKAPQWSAASIRLPLANFHPARREEAAPVAEAETIEAVADLATPADEEAKPVRANRESNISSSEPTVTSTRTEPTDNDGKPKKAGWWQRRGFF